MSSSGTEASSEEFTLEDTLDDLKELKNEREQEIKKLMNIIKNNAPRSLKSNTTPDEIRQKRLTFIQSMEKIVSQEQPKDLPLPYTRDCYMDTLKTLEKEILKMEELEKVTDDEIAELRAEITYTEQKKTAFEMMKEASITAAENENNTQYEYEMKVVKALFQDAKTDLKYVVDTLFPENANFQEFLTELTRAYNKGGDDIYVDVQPETFDVISFLEEADIIRFHPHNKTKVRLRDL